MYIKKESDNGIIKISIEEIEKLSEETLKMVPGIINLGQRNLRQIYDYLIHKKRPSGVKLKIKEDNSVLVTCYIQVSHSSNISELSRQVQKIVKYTIEKQYDLKVSCVDVFIEGVI